MPQFNIQEAKKHLSKLVEAAMQGEEIVIAKAGKPVAQLISIAPKRRLGLLKGKIKLSKDFYAPLPENIISAFEGNSE